MCIISVLHPEISLRKTQIYLLTLKKMADDFSVAGGHNPQLFSLFRRKIKDFIPYFSEDVGFSLLQQYSWSDVSFNLNLHGNGFKKKIVKDRNQKGQPAWKSQEMMVNLEFYVDMLFLLSKKNPLLFSLLADIQSPSSQKTNSKFQR